MLRKSVFYRAALSLTVAFAALSLLVYGVMAQGEDEEPPVVTVQSIAAASVSQTVPVTLTLSIPGPDGPLTVEVPVFLALDIRIALSPELTPTLAVTPSVVSGVEVSPTATLETAVVVTDESPSEPTEEVATPTPTLPAPTATPVPVEVAPTEEPTVALPTATPTATATLEPVAAAPVCADPRSVIIAPGDGEVVSGAVQILGTATHENFLYYKLEYAMGENVDPNNTFSYLADSRAQVTGGLLASFDSTNFANSTYTIKLTVVDNSGNFPPPCTVNVVIQN